MTRHTTKEQLERSLSLLRATLESTADGILVVDRDGRIVDFNQRFLDLWRIPPDVAANKDDQRALEFVLDQLANPAAFLARVQYLYEHPGLESLDLLEFKDGRVFARYARPQQLNGECIGRVWSFRDITERRELEEQLRHSQKMEAIGVLAGGVAHDFNNLLNVITGYVELAQHELPDGHPSRTSLDKVSLAAERAVELTRKLLAFSRKQILQVRSFDLREVIDTFEPILARMVGEDVTLSIERGAEPLIVRADSGQLEQVLLNLCSNARQAMPEGGPLRIEARAVGGDDPRVVSERGAATGRWLRLSVEDGGVGMDRATLARIFEPFFTTKHDGTGLGLATVYGIVQQHGGFVHVESHPGRGTRVELFLPVDSDHVTTVDPGTAVARRDGTETVLVAEDESLLRALIVDCLSAAGYQVLAAEDGAAADALHAARHAEIDLVILDVVMPRLSGPEAWACMRARCPDLRTIFVSGYAPESVRLNEIVASGLASFLPKPFTIEALLAHMRERLDA